MLSRYLKKVEKQKKIKIIDKRWGRQDRDREDIDSEKTENRRKMSGQKQKKRKDKMEIRQKRQKENSSPREGKQ